MISLISIFDVLKPLSTSAIVLLVLLVWMFGVTAQPLPPMAVDSPSTPADSSLLTDTTRQYIRIGRIIVVGNDKTKKQIILREMQITQGDIFDAGELDKIIAADKIKILNTQLFHTAKITVLPLYLNTADILVEVKERWYIFPVPIFDLVDRNFNDWWQNQNRDFSRVNYGLKLYQNNTRGRNEKLKLTLQFGYTRQFGISYNIPSIDHARRHGLTFLFDYSENKNVAFQTRNHKPQFLDDDDPLRIERRIGLGYHFRNNFYTTHTTYLIFNNNDVSDSVLSRNPHYYKDGQRSQKYFTLSYSFRMDHRDYSGYPLQGYWFQAGINQLGLGIYNDLNKTELHVQFSKFNNLGKNYYLSNYAAGYISSPNKQPYSNLSAMGFQPDLIRGYELYLIEGQHYFLNKTTFKKKLFSTVFYLDALPVEQFRYVPFAIYLKGFFDFGYVQNYNIYEENGYNTRLANSFLLGTGMGLDLVTAYDLVIRLEYSINRDKESGFFLHLKKEF